MTNLELIVSKDVDDFQKRINQAKEEGKKVLLETYRVAGTSLQCSVRYNYSILVEAEKQVESVMI